MPVGEYQKHHVLECLAAVSQLDFHALHTASVMITNIVCANDGTQKNTPAAEKTDENEVNEEEEEE